MNYRKLCRFALVFFLVIVFQGNAIAATIHGTAYEWYTFKPLNNTVVEINSTPEQNFIATDSEYSFNLTPGTYAINASYFEGNRVIYKAQEVVVISDEGEYVHDLLLFPPYDDEGLLNQDEVEIFDLGYEETDPVSQPDSQYIFLAPAFLALIILLLAGYFLKKRHEKSETFFYSEGDRESYLQQPESPKIDTEFSDEATTGSADNFIGSSEAYYEQFDQKPEVIPDTDKSLQQRSKPEEEIHKPKEETLDTPDDTPDDTKDSYFHNEDSNKSSPEAPKHSKHNLPDDLKELLELIRASGNRITQRELRKKSPYSESKVSLMLSDLEERGLIEKFKKGRGNIIRIPDMHILKQKERESKKK
ncbi:MAG: MarR family transcriptional regulator [Methanosarcina sp.]|nr:MarR family transcriptional regulator [Methanosarcina sp.]MDD3872797.1 MarR family transcriptional regulator [Methanosarcina sp.]MDD4522321.1 MarR family transcriptional regulator [Methanosarcina sp.]